MQETLFTAALMIVLALTGTDHSAVRWMDREIACLSTCRVVLNSQMP